MDSFFFNDTATTEIYTLSLHDALPISLGSAGRRAGDGHHAHGKPGDAPGLLGLRPVLRPPRGEVLLGGQDRAGSSQDRKSTRLNSSHANISYAVFCL